MLCILGMSSIDLRILISSLEDRILSLEKTNKGLESLFKISCSDHADIVQRIDRMDDDISQLIDDHLFMCENLDPPCDSDVWDNVDPDK